MVDASAPRAWAATDHADAGPGSRGRGDRLARRRCTALLQALGSATTPMTAYDLRVPAVVGVGPHPGDRASAPATGEAVAVPEPHDGTGREREAVRRLGEVPVLHGAEPQGPLSRRDVPRTRMIIGDNASASDSPGS